MTSPAMTPAKVANVVYHTGMPETRAHDLVTGKVRLSYRARCCRVRFALIVASNVHHEGEPTEACNCGECAAAEIDRGTVEIGCTTKRS